MVSKRLNQLLDLLIEKRGIYSILLQFGVSFLLITIAMIGLFVSIMIGGVSESPSFGVVLIGFAVFFILLLPTFFVQIGMISSLKEIQKGYAFNFNQFLSIKEYILPYIGRTILMLIVIVPITLVATGVLLIPTFLGNPESTFSILYQNSVSMLIGSFVGVYSTIYLIGAFFKTRARDIFSENAKEIFVLAIVLALITAIPLIGSIFSIITILLIPYAIILYGESESKPTLEGLGYTEKKEDSVNLEK